MFRNLNRISLVALWWALLLAGCRSSMDVTAVPPDPGVSPTRAADGEPEIHDPLSTDRVLRRAEADLHTTRFDAARAALVDLLKVTPEDRRAHHLMGWALFELGHYAEAEDHFEHAIALDDSDPMTHLWLGKVLAEEIDRAMLLARLPLAKRLLAGFERAAELDPESVPAHTALARYHLEAPAMAGGSAERLQHHVDVLFRLDAAAGHRLEARRHLRVGDEASAERELELAVAASPEDDESYLDLGRLLLQQGRAEAAWTALQRAVELNPGRHEAHVRLAQAALAQDPPELEVARDALTRYLARHPTHDIPSHDAARKMLEGLEAP